jgi:3-deoxy-D-manno-octulosonic-acid transferase
VPEHENFQVLALYYLFAVIVGVFAWPILLFKKKARAGVMQKLGFVPSNLVPSVRSANRPVWFHAVSVGEFNAAWPFISAFHKKHPERKILISNTTATGHELALSRAGDMAEIIFFPYDLPWATAGWLDRVNPACVVIIETEIWPGFYNECRLRRIPLMIANGRISPRSFKQHSRIKPITGQALSCASLIAAQTEEEAARYKFLTGGKTRIEVIGNLKFDGLKTIDKSAADALRQKLRLKDKPVFIAGSTHEGEESVILSAMKSLRNLGQQVTLIMAPRHPERFERVADLIEAAGFTVRRFSKNECIEGDDDVYLLDAIGHLVDFYSLGTIAFVGGTLVNIGGHNLLEPFAYSVPVVCGPNVEKTRDVANALKQIEALCIVEDEKQMSAKLLELMRDKALRTQMGERGRRWLDESQGAVLRAVNLLDSLLSTKDNPELNTTAATYETPKERL